MNLFELTGLYNPEDMKKRTVTTGELNNLLGNEIALLKVIGIKTEYSDPRAYSNDKKEVKDKPVKKSSTKAQRDAFTQAIVAATGRHVHKPLDVDFGENNFIVNTHRSCSHNDTCIQGRIFCNIFRKRIGV